MTEQKDALAEAKDAYAKALEFINDAPESTREAMVAIDSAKLKLQFAQTAALIAIAEALTEKEDG